MGPELRSESILLAVGVVGKRLIGDRRQPKLLSRDGASCGPVLSAVQWIPLPLWRVVHLHACWKEGECLFVCVFHKKWSTQEEVSLLFLLSPLNNWALPRDPGGAPSTWFCLPMASPLVDMSTTQGAKKRRSCFDARPLGVCSLPIPCLLTTSKQAALETPITHWR